MLELSRNDLDVGMVAHDTEAMLHFYGEVVGLAPSRSIPLPGRGTIHTFVAGTNLVKVFAPDGALHLPTDRGEYPWTRAGLQYWTLHVVALDPLVVRLAAAGVEPMGGVNDTGIGIRYILVRDPDGNVVEFIEGDGHRPPRPT
jgi:catechol 2,3-dioxygenase-like lactoylglutathione lyase family enzyme